MFDRMISFLYFIDHYRSKMDQKLKIEELNLLYVGIVYSKIYQTILKIILYLLNVNKNI